MTAHQPAPPHDLSDWLGEGAAVVDGGGHSRRGAVQFIGEWENPATRRVTPRAVFLRPEDGGKEWIAVDNRTLTRG